MNMAFKKTNIPPSAPQETTRNWKLFMCLHMHMNSSWILYEINNRIAQDYTVMFDSLKPVQTNIKTCLQHNMWIKMQRTSPVL